MADQVVGRGVDDGVTVGPMIDRAALDKIDGLVADAVDKGAKVVVGGRARAGKGYFYEPTVLTDVSEDAMLRHAEIFGPVAPVSVFDTEDEAVAAANDTEYGLVAYVYTRDLARALRVSERLETGMVGLNQGVVSNPAAPFGGVKASGLGREGGRIGIDEFLEVKYVGLPRP
jgi:succinate-semialdehyde dehydrogenase / glutarate-semialdehyde dehydrogenase